LQFWHTFKLSFIIVTLDSSLTFLFCMVRALSYYSNQQSEFVMNQGYQLGVDVGGTFTDVYVFTPHGQIVRAKVPTTFPDQSIGIHNGITKAREILKAQFNWSGKFRFIHHGTTTATNAVLEGKGARTALVVTAGHKDILALRRSQIPGGLGAWLYFTPIEPIVPLERVVQCKANVGVGRDCHGCGY
jgi:5-oxoprolinase (ATP-hydrolysing)